MKILRRQGVLKGLGVFSKSFFFFVEYGLNLILRCFSLRVCVCFFCGIWV